MHIKQTQAETPLYTLSLYVLALYLCFRCRRSLMKFQCRVTTSAQFCQFILKSDDYFWRESFSLARMLGPRLHHFWQAFWLDSHLKMAGLVNFGPMRMQRLASCHNVSRKLICMAFRMEFPLQLEPTCSYVPRLNQLKLPHVGLMLQVFRTISRGFC